MTKFPTSDSLAKNDEQLKSLKESLIANLLHEYCLAKDQSWQ